MLKYANRLFTADGWEVFEKFIERNPDFEIFEQCRNRYTRSGEYRNSTHDLAVDADGWFDCCDLLDDSNTKKPR